MISNATKHRQRKNAMAQQAGVAQAGAKRMAANLGRPTRIHADQITAILAPVRTALLAFRMDTAGTRAYHDCAAALSVAYYAAGRIARHRHAQPTIKDGLDALSDVFSRVGDHDWETYFCTPEEIDRIEAAVDVYVALLATTSWPFLKKAISDALPK